MMTKEKLILSAKAFIVTLLFIVFGLTTPVDLDASSSNSTSAFFNKGTSIFDDFNNLYLFPDGGQYWWVEHGGDIDDQNTFAFIREQYCAMQTCIQPLHENQEKYVRLEVKANDNDGVFTIANLSEEIDNFDFIFDSIYDGLLEPGAWNPTVGSPVVMEQRMRFSANYNADGSGGAVGSGGMWLWSNPFSQGAPDPFAIYDGFGFSWSQQGTLGAPGLHAVQLRSTFPVFVELVRDINPQDWNTYKTVWSVDEVGAQTIEYYINDQLVASTPVIGASMQDMSVEIWIDNQFFTIGDQGFPVILRIPVPQDQYFDIDYLSVYHGTPQQPTAAQLDIQADSN